MSSLAFIETNLSVNHNPPMTVIFTFTRKKNIYGHHSFIYSHLKNTYCARLLIYWEVTCAGEKAAWLFYFGGIF